MKNLLVAATALAVLVAGAITPAQEVPNVPPWLCDWIPILCKSDASAA